MSVTTNQITSEIEAHIRKCGGTFRQWYVGITSDARERLFSGHKVRENGDAWIHRQAGTHQEARQIEGYFVNQLGTRGGPGGGSTASRSVYAYKITAHTVE
ncbi:MAG: hypothetical protein F4X94_10210 [Dehalococcoidia bacterium]|nr:hypothetical protein [Dehalococcoidia bacterium]